MLEPQPTPKHGELLVAIMNDRRDMAIAREKGWYRIPVRSAQKWLRDRWPPQWLAFYQTKEFASERYTVRYYARVLAIQKQYRWQLFPNEPQGKKTNRLYYKISLDALQKRPEPIVSLRWRRIVFIPTTWEKFMTAVEINDLYDGSPLEDRLWVEFKRHRITADRQWWVAVKAQNYFLDFAIKCAEGQIDIETDGDSWHANPERADADNLRDNALKVAGWTVLRFNTKRIREQAATYCLSTVSEKINKLGGLDEGGWVPRKIDPDATAYQPSLFD